MSPRVHASSKALEVSAPIGAWAIAKDFVSLTKPRLSGQVLFTAAGGMWLSGVSVPWWTWVCTLLGTAGTVGAANAFNCVMERESDRHMGRTQHRPLPSGRMEATPALAFAAAMATFSLPLLWAGSNTLTGVLGLLAIFSYVLLYTPLKSRTHLAMQVGAFPGALPPLMGWTAASGHISAMGLALFGILFFWQLPHFIAIALFRKREYQAAGLTSLPLALGDGVARWHAVAYLVALLVVSLVPLAIGAAGVLYGVLAVLLGVGFLAEGLRGALRNGDAVWARRLFGVSLLYLTALFVTLGVDFALRS
jgi:protoheme IX farnesyltransferase